jgi:hypothetical protein
MTKYDQLRNEVRREMHAMKLRIAMLETLPLGRSTSAFAEFDLRSRPPRRKRAPAPRPDDAEVAESIRLWKQYQDVAGKMYGKGSQRSSKSAFAGRYHFPEREFYRAFSLTDQRGLGSAPRKRYNAAIIEATSTLKQALKSHGTHRDSPLSGLKPAV